mmetsp:Transcript_6504/g.14787  ORF Transcript_6504/g.14787 Transcript_6504/m.14787 type:complete len:145 (-) Transcript_6504:1167-1601(-)
MADGDFTGKCKCDTGYEGRHCEFVVGRGPEHVYLKGAGHPEKKTNKTDPFEVAFFVLIGFVVIGIVITAVFIWNRRFRNQKEVDTSVGEHSSGIKTFPEDLAKDDIAPQNGGDVPEQAASKAAVDSPVTTTATTTTTTKMMDGV